MLENNENLENSVEDSSVSTTEEVSQVINEVDNAIAEEAQEPQEEKNQIPTQDYGAMELEDLTKELGGLLQSYPVEQIKQHVEAIKIVFNSKFGELLSQKKEAFLAEGGNSIDFNFSSPIKTEYNKLLSDYRKKRDAHYKEVETKLNENLEKRNAIIEELKNIIEKSDPKTMYNEYKVLNDRWKQIGAVPRSKYNDTWKVYHHHVERFYDLLHLNKDFRELDFKHNLEEKLKLIARAEELGSSEDVNAAFKELQELHRIWKEEIGPVGKEHREDVWNRFSEATKKLHDRRHDFFKDLRGKQQEIIAAKLEIINQIDSFDTSRFKSHKDWQKGIKSMEALRQQFFDAGKLPYNKSEDVWQKFKLATKKFNSDKNAFYKEEKKEQSDNLKRKMELVELAESLKDSEDWDATVNTMKRIQSDWKKIGHVPRKFSDEIWNRFKGACNHFFDRLHDRKNVLNQEQQKVVDAKKAFLETFKAQENLTVEQVKEAIVNWNNLGGLPRNARHLDEKFDKSVSSKFKDQDFDKSEIEMLKFKGVVDNYMAQEDFRKLDNEQLFIRRKIDDTVREMQQLENNLSFISNATEDNPLVQNVRKGIQNFKDDLDIWQMKLDYLKRLDY